MFPGPASSKAEYVLLRGARAHNMHLILFPSLADQSESLVVENVYIYIQTIWIPPVANIRHSLYPVGDCCSSHLSHALTDLQTQKCTHIPPVAGPDLWPYLHLTLRPPVFQVAGLDLLVPHEANTQTP